MSLPSLENRTVARNILKSNLILSINLALTDFKIKHSRSTLGVLWLLLIPIGMLLVYWGVFGYTLNISWPSTDGGSVGFVLPFFIGYSVYMFFSDIITSSLNLFVSKRNYVKKSPFPLWVLWLSNFVRSLIQVSVYVILIILLSAALGYLSIYGLFLFVILFLFSLIFFAALSLFLSSIGPFLSDLSEASRVILRVLFYLAPITYPLTIAPPEVRFILWFNPITNIVEPVRNALIFGRIPDAGQFVLFTAISVLLLITFTWFFKRASEAIVDVV